MEHCPNPLPNRPQLHLSRNFSNVRLASKIFHIILWHILARDKLSLQRLTIKSGGAREKLRSIVCLLWPMLSKTFVAGTIVPVTKKWRNRQPARLISLHWFCGQAPSVQIITASSTKVSFAACDKGLPPTARAQQAEDSFHNPAHLASA